MKKTQAHCLNGGKYINRFIVTAKKKTSEESILNLLNRFALYQFSPYSSIVFLFFRLSHVLTYKNHFQWILSCGCYYMGDSRLITINARHVFSLLICVSTIARRSRCNPLKSLRFIERYFLHIHISTMYCRLVHAQVRYQKYFALVIRSTITL